LVLQIARLEPFPEYRSIHRDVLEKPEVTDVVKAALDISLKNP